MMDQLMDELLKRKQLFNLIICLQLDYLTKQARFIYKVVHLDTKIVKNTPIDKKKKTDHLNPFLLPSLANLNLQLRFILKFKQYLRKAIWCLPKKVIN